MGVTNKLFQARFFLRSPIARLWLALRFDDVPTVVPPAMIIVGRIRRQHFGRRGGVFRIGAHGSEYQELSAFGDLIVEDGFLRVGLVCQDKNWTNLESFHLVDGAGAESCAGPVLIFRQSLPILCEIGRVLLILMRSTA